MIVYPAGNEVEVTPGVLQISYFKDQPYKITQSSASVNTNSFCEALDTGSADIYREDSNNEGICNFISLEYRELDTVR